MKLTLTIEIDPLLTSKEDVEPLLDTLRSTDHDLTGGEHRDARAREALCDLLTLVPSGAVSVEETYL